MADTSKLVDLYTSLKPSAEHFTSGSLSDGLYINVLRAALAKSYEFNCVVTKSKDAPFFLMATLRGMCEDVIVLKFIQSFKVEDRNEILELLLKIGIFEALHNQEEFFDQHRSFQPILKPTGSKADIDKLRDEVLKLRRAYSSETPNNHLPSIRKMAKSQGLLPFYEYLYSATSRLVHFSPQVLLRMGWGPEPKPDMDVTFSTDHFKDYYTAFNQLYGTFLFIMFFDNFKAELSFDVTWNGILEQLRKYINDWPRWPELVTFEEVNQAEPTPHQYTMRQILHSAATVIRDKT